MAKDKAARVQTKLKVSNVNVRMELAGKDARGNLGTDVHFTGIVHLEQAEKLLGDIHASAILRACFDAEGGLRTPTFKKFDVGTEIKDATVTLGAGKLRTVVRDAKVNQIVLIPTPGNQFELKLRMQANLPPKDQSTLEYEFYKDVVTFIVDGGERVHEEDGQTGLALNGGGEGEGDGEGTDE